MLMFTALQQPLPFTRVHLGNADLGWETTASFNIGIDFGLFDRRISGSLDLYKAKNLRCACQQSTSSDNRICKCLDKYRGNR